MTTLTVRRKADRLAMAKGIEAIALKHGATCTYSAQGSELSIGVAHPTGLMVGLTLRGRSTQTDVHVIPWHIAMDSAARLDMRFGAVNPHHFCKATHVAYGWEALATEIDRGLSAAADGSAFVKAEVTA